MITTEINTSLEYALTGLKTLLLSSLKSFETNERLELESWDITSWSASLLPHLPVKKISDEELVIITLALAPHIRPHYFDRLIQSVYPNGGGFPHLGGIRGKGHRGFLPSGETALFLLAGENLEYRFRIQQLFSPEHWFAKKQVIRLAEPERNEPAMSGQLILDQEFIDKITLGRITSPSFSTEFPAAKITTEQYWNDLILPSSTSLQIQDILIWLKYKHALFEGLEMRKKLKPGYRALFHGPPGTGKTLTANLLGKHTNRDVYRVDLSSVVSKYIGETEKNLANLFNKAENKDWILFFDEADALFGRRTQVQNSHDRYANQEVAYLLQRVETYKGLIILASNFRSNIDEAFVRRFQSIIHFPMPRTQERLSLWQNAFPNKLILDKDIDLKQLAQKFELTGADIMNVVQYVCLNVLAKESHVISYKDITEGIKREFVKSGKFS
ncbi:ATP-binding protein [Aquimarina sp. AU119]|uniref:ATP-binding protein n=1 Tax=Aquimarina sp. AU119 TaxID=2108528 RepID=UPI000D69BA62|nr:ATP-binding protein [Aquimarina sp. AU119]